MLSKPTAVVFVLVVLLVPQVKSGKGGKAATKVGLVGISQVVSGSRAGTQQGDGGTLSFYDGRNSSDNYNQHPMARLKYDLLIKNGYDKAIRPVLNHTHQVLVELDLSYIQALNLDEKDQTLKSLLWSRVYWKDEFLTWNPEDYDNITNIRLPANSFWVPDIVIYEEIGVKDYSPRLPYAEVSYDGTVRYLEPTTYETTCSVNIAHFPFDYQACKMTFTTWTFPTSRVDIKSRRSRKELLKDIAIYFVKSGEWVMYDIEAAKISQSYATVFGTDDISVEEFREKELLLMDPEFSVKEVAPNRVTELHWSNLEFTFIFRRNSSLYMQSMLFPALLLTTISLLGFYLPPDSGERIGLQITIMLTFMVFLLTVGDMFPASTGPYIGVYFVLCMALLGINIIMTVLVLHLHHMPCEAVMDGPNDKMEYIINFTAVPYWIRFFLSISGLTQELKNFKLTDDDPNGSKCDLNDKKKSFFSNAMKPMWSTCKTFFRSKKLVAVANFSEGSSDVEKGNGAIRNCNSSSTAPSAKLPIFSVNREYHEVTDSATRKRFGSQSIMHSYPAQRTQVDTMDAKGHDTDGKLYTQKEAGCNIAVIPNTIEQKRPDSAYVDMCGDVKNLRSGVTSLTGYLHYQNGELKDQKRCDAMQEKWKAVARRVDILCLRLYLVLLVIFHAAILFAILWDTQMP